METLRFRIIGESPLLQHNGDLANPFNKWSRALKKISSKRSKTDEDHMEMARLEWCGGLYLSDGAPCIPANVVEAALSGKGGPARKVKKGQQAAAGLVVEKNAVLEYEGPKDIEELWKDEGFRLVAGVVIKGSRIFRTRPIFRDWAATIEVLYRPDLLNEADIVSWMTVLGRDVGIGDWRPKFGRFQVEKVERLVDDVWQPVE